MFKLFRIYNLLGASKQPTKRTKKRNSFYLVFQCSNKEYKIPSMMKIVFKKLDSFHVIGDDLCSDNVVLIVNSSSEKYGYNLKKEN